MPIRRRFALPASGALIVAASVLTAPATAFAATSTSTVFGFGTPGFVDSSAPSSLSFANNAGEPSIGDNWGSGAALFMAASDVFKIGLADSASAITWTDVSPLTGTCSCTNIDPILATDHSSGTTLAGGDDGACDVLNRSTDDGMSWTPSIPCTGSYDHPTVGFGPTVASALPSGLPAVSGDLDAYECQQGTAVTVNGGPAPGPILPAECSRSLDGGQTWSPAVATQACTAEFGHIKAAPDGTVYVPGKDCSDALGNQGVGGFKSSDNGQDWTGYVIVDPATRKPVPVPSRGFDPSVAVDNAGTLYESWARAGDYHPVIARSTDGGATWSPIVDLSGTGPDGPIAASTFQAVVAGDAGRVAVAYLGTTDAPSATGPTPFDAGFVGHWYLYVSYSYDGGQTWTTINATPAQPVQVGSICDQGFNCSSTDQRNLLDFIDATVTKDGRVLVAFADGCGAINPNSTTCSATSTDISKSVSSWATIAYQTTGRGLFAADDKSAPSAPTLTATGGSSAINLSWTTPDPGTDPITSYQVLRGTDPSSLAPLATVPVGTNSYSDGTAQFGTTYYYAVTASSDIGTGAPSNVVSASLAAQPPAATTLSAADNNNSVLLSWTTPASPGSPITGYQIYRGTAPGTETAYMTAGPTATSFVDSQVSAQTPYYYRIAAVNGAGTGALSNETSATPTTVPSAATLTALAGKGQASLSWTSPNSGGATISGWRILRGTTSGTETLIQTITTGTTYVDNTVVAGTTYFYEVVAVNKNGAGAASNEASVTVKKGK